MDPKQKTDRMKAACQTIANDLIGDQKLKTLAQAILDANDWLDTFYKDLRGLAEVRDKVIARLDDLDGRLNRVERKLEEWERK
jgi:hypothetical protein